MAVAGSAGQPPSTGRTRNPVPRGYWRTPTMRADMVLRYVKRGQSMGRIAADLGCSYGTVHAVLTAEGVQKRSRGGPNNARRAAASSPAPGADRIHRVQQNAAAATSSGAGRRGPRSGADGAGGAGAVS